jgi:phosphohistidine swiveling domain-containing protein
MTQFEFDSDRDMKAYRLWMADLTHFPKGFATPLSAFFWTDPVTYGHQYACEKLMTPETKGWDYRVIDGYSYFTIIECDPEEVPEREEVFREKVRPFIEDFEGEWKKEMDQWMGVVDHFKKFELRKASDLELREHFEDYFTRIHYRWREIHFYWMYPVFTLFTLFSELCQELLGIGISDSTFQKLISGFDNRLFRVNRDLWRFGDRVKELGLGDLFLSTKNDEELLAKLEGSHEGKKWLKEYHEWLEVEGWRNIDLWDVYSPTWLENPSLPLRDIKQGIEKGGAFGLDAAREALAREREEAEQEVLGKVPAEQKDWFEKLMRVAQKCSVFSEEHNYYLDQQAAAITRRILLEYGRRFAEAGVIDERDDIFFILPSEIRKASIALKRIDLRSYVKARKEEREGYLKIDPKPYYGDIDSYPELARKNAVTRVSFAPPNVRPDLKADLYGGTSAPGVAEGIARVLINERDLDQLKPGEILVTVATSVPWTPAFSVVSAVVTNAGGGLSHAVIVAREYGIPAVIGTREATKKIKTGDRIRVDGDLGTVYIVERSGQ